eukprot:CAMPEP_0168368380 /NCGR_PEP_ID=MMETSP0228-20121227/6221_1 /TAXON_ID=133427 /ORGANISM="Protoceratium reticulatum, Strain CCCM 535 (=CCMP 1889)" /LENGTH=77 /DNA_ID=CAMNT_0008381225 /DNA_START=415 /DNA_END=645 /DNA_ORIENTATION=-
MSFSRSAAISALNVSDALVSWSFRSLIASVALSLALCSGGSEDINSCVAASHSRPSTPLSRHMPASALSLPLSHWKA